MLSILPAHYSEDRELTAAEASTDRVSDDFLAVMTRFTEFEQEEIMRKLTDKLQLIATPRAGRALEAVVHFLKEAKSRQQPLTVLGVREAVAAQGVNVTPKEIYNALGYLTRKQKIHRLDRGQYGFGSAQQKGTND